MKFKNTELGIDENNFNYVKYNETKVVKFKGDKIVLNTNGWKTPNIKRRMNRTSKIFNLGYEVFQREGFWYIRFKGRVFPFINSSVELKR